jgi:hypothetical protein
MGRNGFLDESKREQWPLPKYVWPGINKMKLTPAVGAFIDRFRPSTWGRSETLIRATVRERLIALIMADRLHECHAALGELLGLGTPDGVPAAGRFTERAKDGV